DVRPRPAEQVPVPEVDPHGPSLEKEGPGRAGPSLRVDQRLTALNAFTWPEPYHEFWPLPPVQVWTCSSSVPRKVRYPSGSESGHGCGSAVCWMRADPLPGGMVASFGPARVPN